MEIIGNYFRVSMLLVIIVSAIAGISGTATQVSAQSFSASFNPQTQFLAGSSFAIKSMYGIATVNPLRNQTHGNIPPGNEPPGGNRGEQSLRTYSASITVKVQVASDSQNGGLQLTVQGGAIVINGVTFTITEGKGDLSKIDLLTLEGTATGTNSFKWHIEGLAALYNGSVISNLNANATNIDIDNSAADVSITCIATMG
jgi:hypothetical protein